VIPGNKLQTLLEDTMQTCIEAAQPTTKAELGMLMELLIRTSLNVVNQNIGHHDMLLSLGQVSRDYGLIPAAKWPVSLH